MGLLVLVLRSYLVFQNIYVTYKTLKLPLSSSRSNGKPSIRAMTQRKRDMKGCMAIWLVWCCLAAYESAVERIISIFIPFYDEIKSVILVLFILARARGAEPIYLHVIRPFLKPYVPMIDAFLGMLHSVGDFALLLMAAPLSPLLSWWHRRTSGDATSSETDSSDLTERADPPPPYHYPERPAAPRNGSLEVSMAKFYATDPPAQSGHEIWHPPPSAHEKERRTAVAPMSMPEPSIPSFGNPDDSWRAYPPFPSAYPPTPVRPSGVPIPQLSSEYINGDRQDFRQSLLPPRELNPSSDGGLSDEIRISGVQDHSFQPIALNDTNNEDNDHEDSDYEMEEDTFDITLRTPYPLRSRPEVALPAVISRNQSHSSIATATTVASSETESVDSMSILTGLSTVRHAPTLRTTASMTSSAADSDTTSVLSRKRRLSGVTPGSASPSADSDVSNVFKPTKTPSRRAVRIRLANARRGPTKVASLRSRCESPSSKEASGESAKNESSSTTPKRRRLAHSPKPKPPRPARGNAAGAAVARKALTADAVTKTARAPMAAPSRSSSLISTRVAAAAAPSRLPRATVTVKSGRRTARGAKTASGQTGEHEARTSTAETGVA